MYIYIYIYIYIYGECVSKVDVYVDNKSVSNLSFSFDVDIRLFKCLTHSSVRATKIPTSNTIIADILFFCPNTKMKINQEINEQNEGEHHG